MVALAQSDRVELVNLYHLAQSALSDLAQAPTAYERMCWAARAFVADHPERGIPRSRAYKALCEALGAGP